MKRLFPILLTLVFLFSNQGQLNAALVLKVIYKVPLDTESEDFDSYYSPSYLSGSSKDRVERKKALDLIKTKQMKTKLISGCKYMDAFNARVKITDARNATSGLGNLKSVSVSEIRVEEQYADLPEYTQEEYDLLYEEYEYEEDFPDYSEEGYSWYSIEATCLFSGTIAITSSNAYRIYIDGKSGPEYSRTELVKMRWAVTLVDN
jgi:hypothetical protein